MCYSQEAMNIHLQNLLSEVLKPIAENNGGVEAISSEDMLSSIDRLNRYIEDISNDPKCDPNTKRSIQETVLVGADAVALYPELKKDRTAEIVAEVFLRTDVDIDGVNWKELSVYVSMNSNAKQQKAWKVYQHIPKRKKAQRVTPGMNSMLGAGGSEKQWEYAPEPGKLGTKLLMAAATRIRVLPVFETHVYAFGGHEFKQSDGGPIGLRFTGVLARIRVSHWANKVINVLESNNIKVLLAKSYVDDFRFILQGITRGLRYIP